MKDFVYFQITQNSKTFRYFGLKENEWMPHREYGTRHFEMLPMLNLLIKKNVHVFEDLEISGKLLYTKNIS